MLLDRRIPLGYILRKFRYDILLVGVIGAPVYFVKREFKDFLPHIPIAIPAFIGTAISVIPVMGSVTTLRPCRHLPVRGIG